MTPIIAGIKRKENYSPNHITNDSLILSCTGEALKKYGYKIKYYDETFIEESTIEEEVIFSMVRGPKGLLKLKELDDAGKLIVNSPASALNCYRVNTIDILSKAGIPIPASIITDVENCNTDFFETLDADKIWLKRGDVHAEHKEDVTCVRSLDELHSILSDFKKRSISKVVVQKHLTGDVVKFYSVMDSDFFHWYYTNGADMVEFDEVKLKEIAASSARLLGIDVYGGDAIISPEGSISIIDLNDWPSFAPVRDQAADAIAELIHNKISKSITMHYKITTEEEQLEFSKEQNYGKIRN